MDYIAEAKNIKMSPRKVRLVVDAIRSTELSKALLQLSIADKRAATPVRKVIQSAMANAINTFKVDKDTLSIKEILVNEGIRYKRYHFAGRGRMRPYVKRTSHIRVVLKSKPAIDTAIKASEKAIDVVSEDKSALTRKIALPGKIVQAVSKRVRRSKKEEKSA